MPEQRFQIIRAALVAGATCALCLTAPPALAIDWDSVAGKDVTLFYPGQASWEWVLTQSSHSGAKKFRGGKNCRGCHDGEQATIGDLIVSGKKLEPAPIMHKRGSIPAHVQVAHDAERLYFRLEWFEQALNGFPVMDPDYEAKVTVMLDDGAVAEATRAGCWGACHDDAYGMVSAQEGQDLKKYLARSRTRVTRSGGGLNFASDADLAALAEQGVFLEYWQARLNHDAAAVAAMGSILKDRNDAPSDEVSAESSYAHGKWTVVLSRPLATSAARSKALVPGKTYTVGFAVHDAYAGRRFHHVSFEYSLVIDSGEADFVAVGQ